MIIPGGFGVRGIEGMIAAANHCRVRNVPMLGVCLGMQVAVIEFARSVLGWEGMVLCACALHLSVRIVCSISTEVCPL